MPDHSAPRDAATPAAARGARAPKAAIGPYRRDPATGVYARGGEGIAFSDGEGFEAKLLHFLRGVDDLTVLSDEIHAGIVDWPTEAHLSAARSNLLRHVRLGPGQRILEVGAGCGALTRYLGESGAQVHALEGALPRAACAVARCRDLRNVHVVRDELTRFVPEGRYDVVTLIGVLEYARRFVDAPDPVHAILACARELLAPGGVLLLAIENQLGLKYFNGCEEDHLGAPFSGITDLYDARTVVTFGRHELGARLRAAGFAGATWHYPFPDYKLPSVVVGDNAFDAQDFSVSDLLFGEFARDYSGNLFRVFDEANAWPVLERNAVLRDFANSFLVTASTGELGTAPDRAPNAIAYKYSTSRRRRYATATTFVRRDGDGLAVVKEALDPAAAGVSAPPALPLVHRLGTEPYLPGPLFAREFTKAVARGHGLPELASRLQPWVGVLLAQARPPAGARAADAGWAALEVPGELFDVVPFNLVVDASGSLQAIDREFAVAGDVPLPWVVLRGLVHTADKCFGHRVLRDLTGEAFVRGMLPLLGLADLPDLEPYLALEDALVREVLRPWPDRPPSRIFAQRLALPIGQGASWHETVARERARAQALEAGVRQVVTVLAGHADTDPASGTGTVAAAVESIESAVGMLAPLLGDDTEALALRKGLAAYREVAGEIAALRTQGEGTADAQRSLRRRGGESDLSGGAQYAQVVAQLKSESAALTAHVAELELARDREAQAWRAVEAQLAAHIGNLEQARAREIDAREALGRELAARSAELATAHDRLAGERAAETQRGAERDRRWRELVAEASARFVQRESALAAALNEAEARLAEETRRRAEIDAAREESARAQATREAQFSAHVAELEQARDREAQAWRATEAQLVAHVRELEQARDREAQAWRATEAQLVAHVRELEQARDVEAQAWRATEAQLVAHVRELEQAREREAQAWRATEAHLAAHVSELEQARVREAQERDRQALDREQRAHEREQQAHVREQQAHHREQQTLTRVAALRSENEGLQGELAQSRIEAREQAALLAVAHSNIAVESERVAHAERDNAELREALREARAAEVAREGSLRQQEARAIAAEHKLARLADHALFRLLRPLWLRDGGADGPVSRRGNAAFRMMRGAYRKLPVSTDAKGKAKDWFYTRFGRFFRNVQNYQLWHSQRATIAALAPMPAGDGAAPHGQAPAFVPALPAEGASVSVVIPAYGKAEMTRRCIEVLRAAEPALALQVIVVDDGSPEPIAPALADLPDVTLVRNEQNLGFIGAVNRGAEVATEPYLLLLNNDAEVRAGAVSEMLATFARHPEAGIVGCKLVFPDGRLQEAGAAIRPDGTADMIGLWDDPARGCYAYEREVAYTSGACLMIERGLWQTVGGLDAAFAPAYCEDSDLCFRVRHAGRTVVYQPRATVVHQLSASMQDSRIDKQAVIAVNQRTFLERWGATIRAEHAVRAIAFYLPQYHAIPENDRWWGPGFTEWTNVAKARPAFPGHRQPNIPADLGFYDLRNAAARRAQADLARRYGIHGFCYYYYWFHGKRLLHEPLDAMLASGEPDFPFCVCWANENWTRRWDGLDAELLVAQEHSPEDDLQFIESLFPLFRDPRYIRVHGRPLLMVYRPSLLPDAQATVARWRRHCADHGLPAPYLLMTQSFYHLNSTGPQAFGFDAAVEFPPHSLAVEVPSQPRGMPGAPFDGRVYDYRATAENFLRRDMPPYRLFRSVMPRWDNTPRRGPSGNVFLNSTPEAFGDWLQRAVEDTRKFAYGDERIVFINAWNEWAEGNYLEPDLAFGHAYLEAARAVLMPPNAP